MENDCFELWFRIKMNHQKILFDNSSWWILKKKLKSNSFPWHFPLNLVTYLIRMKLFQWKKNTINFGKTESKNLIEERVYISIYFIKDFTIEHYFERTLLSVDTLFQKQMCICVTNSHSISFSFEFPCIIMVKSFTFNRMYL